MNNVAIYLRKSREDEELKEETLTRHETMLLEYCNRNRLAVSKIYKEVVSGENIKNRPEMQKLLSDVSCGLYDGVVCIELERLSRGNPVDQCEILEVFKESNTKIYTLNKVYDLSKEEIDEEYFEFALFMSRREYKTIVRRMQRGRLQATKDGYFTGGILPYGFEKERVDGGWILKPHPQEAQVVRHIFNMYVNGVGTWKIAQYLNSKGIKTRHGKTWQDFTVLALIANQNYIGKVRSSKLNEWIDGKHKGIIHPIVFERAQVIKAQTSTKCKRSKEVKNPLATFTRCGICGYVMHRRPNKSGIEYLTCHRCENKAARMEDVENALLNCLKEELNNFNHFLLNYEDKMQDDRTNRENEKIMLEKELVKRRQMLSKACEMLEQGIYTVELFTSRTSALKAEIGDIEKRIESLENEKPDADVTARTAIPIIENVLARYHTLNAEGKNKLLKSIVKSVVYTNVDHGINLDVALLV